MVSSGLPSLEILLPFYGDPALYRATVRSVVAQTDPEWTLVVHDDGYPDPTVGEWTLSLNDPRIGYYRNKTNLGARLNYERALRMARGDYVTVLGADDLMAPDYVAAVRRQVAVHAPDILQPGVRVIDEADREVTPLVDRIKRQLRPAAGTHRGEPVVRSLMHGNWSYFPSMAWRREAIQDLQLRDYGVVQDLGLLVDVLTRGGSILIDDRVIFSYRRHTQSDSAKKSVTGARFEEEAELYRELADGLGQRGWNSAARAARTRWSSRLNALMTASFGSLDIAARGRLLRRAVGDW